MPVDFDALVLGPTFDAFAEPVTWIPAAGGVITTWGGADNAGRGVFDEGATVITAVGGEAPMSLQLPLLGVRLSEFTTRPKQNDRVTVPSAGRTYIVRDIRPDEHGHASVLLEATT